MPNENDPSLTLGPTGIDDDDIDGDEAEVVIGGGANKKPASAADAEDYDAGDEDDATYEDEDDEPKSNGQDDDEDALEEARAQAAIAELGAGEREQEAPKPKPKPKAKPEAQDDDTDDEDETPKPKGKGAETLSAEIESLVEDFGIDRYKARTIATRQQAKLDSVVKQAQLSAKQIVDEALAPYKGIFEASRKQAEREYTESIDRSIDEWSKKNKVVGLGSGGKYKGSERLFRAVLVRESRKLASGLPESARNNLTDDALFRAALPAAQLYMDVKGFKPGASKSSQSKPKSQANGSVTRPPGFLPGASAASAQRPGGRTQGTSSKAAIVAKMRAVAAGKAS